jgi:sugar phosphate isomerase/epimerase
MISRRKFFSLTAIGAIALERKPDLFISPVKNPYPVRLGGPLAGDFSDPSQWVMALRKLRYSTAYCPVDTSADNATILAFKQAALDADILISEVGAWGNPLADNAKERFAAIDKCKKSLLLADKIGAACCVNISGSRGSQWDGPDPRNFTDETFYRIVSLTREIIDEVDPRNACFTLEPMPNMYPDSPDSYLKLIKAINRKKFAVHLDPVNMISSPERYYNNEAFIKECFVKLGPYIKSVHAKDIILQPKLTVHLDEIRPGLGNVNYQALLKEVSRFKGLPVMMEHLETQEEYSLSAAYIRQQAELAEVKLY